MKKARSLFSLLLALALVATSLPMVFMTAIAETTDESTTPTYYVSWAGDDTNDGLSADTALRTIAAAVNKIGLANDGTVVITDTTCEIYAFASADAQKVVVYDAPEHTGVLTIKGATAAAPLCSGVDGLVLNGPTVLQDLTLYKGYVPTDMLSIATFGNNLTTKGTINYMKYAGTANEESPETVANNGYSASTNEQAAIIEDLTYDSTKVIISKSGKVLFQHTGVNIYFTVASDYQPGEAWGTTQTIIYDGANPVNIRTKVGKNSNTSHTVSMGNVNYVINNGSPNIVTNNDNWSVGKTSYTNLTFLFNNGAEPSAISTGCGNNMFTANKMYFVLSDATEGSSLMTTETPGTFEVIGNKIAVATNGSTGEVVKSVDGILTITGAAVASGVTNSVTSLAAAKTMPWTWTVTYEDAPAPAPEFDYTAAISPATATVEREANVAVKVTVASEVKENWASAQLTVEYDADRLTFVPEDDASYTYKDENGVLTIGIYGDTKELGDVVTLNFKTVADADDCDVNAVVTLKSAGFSTQKDAEESNLSVADITADEAVITITKKTLTITVNATDNGNPILDLDADSVTEGDDVVFGIVSGGENYDYTVSYKVGDADAVELTVGQDGKYTIPGSAVTDDLTITATRTPKIFGVSGSVTAGEGATLNENDVVKVGDITLPNDTVKATFGTSITFKIPADVAAGLEAGADYTYTVEVGGAALESGYSVSADGTEITVEGTYITGDVAIAVVKNHLAPNVFTVNVTGTGASDVTVSAEQVNLNAPLTITLNKVAGYDYVVTVTMGDDELELTPVDGVYTIEAVTANVAVTVTKTEAYVLSASIYFQVDGTVAWLVINRADKLENGNYTVNGIQMMWSDAYEGGAYVAVIFADENPVDNAVVAIDASTTAETVADGFDANKTGTVDANDAQFVYNIYNGEYTEITGSLTMEKLLRADVNGDKVVDSVDAQAIISSVIG